MLQDTKVNETPQIGELFTIKEVTDKLKISRWTLDRLTEEKGIKTLKVGNSIRYTADEVAKLISQ